MYLASYARYVVVANPLIASGSVRANPTFGIFSHGPPGILYFVANLEMKFFIRIHLNYLIHASLLLKMKILQVLGVSVYPKGKGKILLLWGNRSEEVNSSSS